ncbi:hypothetical protein DFJ74DRAFT_684787 [Hyaloraphidium curvatum]|nr:hypothetical protein DFJ74DRAFT_684787 [Hyaloraphidium curvatum]
MSAIRKGEWKTEVPWGSVPQGFPPAVPSVSGAHCDGPASCGTLCRGCPAAHPPRPAPPAPLTPRTQTAIRWSAAPIAAELAGRFAIERPGLPAFALTEPCVLTAVGNDYSCERVFARQVEAACGPGDVLLAITTSGTSPNILAALAATKRKGAATIALCGLGGQMDDADVRVRVPSRDTPRVQEVQMLLGHAICEMVEREMFGGGDAGDAMD